MVTTPNSLKYLKFAGGLSEKNIRKWIESVDNTFGVVKWDKSTRFFHGDMVQSSYQLLNTLGLDKVQAEELLKPSFDYISLVRNDVEFMRYHFTDAYVREKDGGEKRKSLTDLPSVPTLFLDCFSVVRSLIVRHCMRILETT